MVPGCAESPVLASAKGLTSRKNQLRPGGHRLAVRGPQGRTRRQEGGGN